MLPGEFDVQEQFSDDPLKLSSVSFLEFEMQEKETRVFRLRAEVKS